MTHETSEHTTSTFFTFVAGAIAGAAVALIFAPSNGRDARAVLADRSRRAVEKGRDVFNEQASRVKSAIERGREQVEAFGERFDRGGDQTRSGHQESQRRELGPMARETSSSRVSGFSE